MKDKELSKTMLIKYMWEHTDKKGKWSKRELPEEKRNEELKRECILEAL